MLNFRKFSKWFKLRKDYRKYLAGLIKHEHVIDVKKLFAIISPYVESYAKAYIDYSARPIGKKIELISAWVNYMTKFESNPMHSHDEDLSFVIYTKIGQYSECEWRPC